MPRPDPQPAGNPRQARALAEAAAAEQVAQWPRINAITDAIARVAASPGLVHDAAEAMHPRTVWLLSRTLWHRPRE